MPSSTIRSISITVSDDDGATAPAAPAPLRARAGRRKVARGLGQRAVRLVARWWPVLLLLPAVALLLFEASRLRASPTAPGPPVSSLGRLDPTTRLVRGVREPCLKLLSPKSLANLAFPEGTGLDYLVKTIIYKSDDDDYDTYRSEADSTYLLQHAEASRFNLFTGFQTLTEREDGFKVNGTVNVHCGFYSDNGGFKMSDEDRRYMRACKVVVSTCAFGGGDDLYQPIGMTNSSIGRVCYVAFWDKVTQSTQEAEGKIIGDNGMIGRWRIIVVKSVPFVDQRLNGKIPKMLSHRLFPEARYSIWVDSKYQFRRDPIGVLEALLWRTNSTFAISEHGARSSIYDEGKAIVQKHKATPEEVEVQLTQYRQDGMPDDKRLHGLKALAEASVIVRELTPGTNHFMCAWFNEVVRFTSRDQLSFPYVLWRLNMPGISMFPVCTRRDLVNSLGHTRKVKPLTQMNSESSAS
ncbi:probable hexosyltransferase MUCI70 [Phragmites australis]|uniref:probable hexosyltransferase MUCI70 n=1 Tax=Phragmites australis TaxID=29695 RepID=UPI002D78EFD0|nr:probable hexosyltransferase MUCI70 [Phragmites australis]